MLGGAPRCCCVKHVPEPHTEVLLSLVGRMSAVLPIRKYCARARTTGNRHMQARSGAPGLDRTADTRFRNSVGIVSLVVRCVRLCCTVQGCGRAWCWAVLRRGGPWGGVSAATCRQLSGRHMYDCRMTVAHRAWRAQDIMHVRRGLRALDRQGTSGTSVRVLQEHRRSETRSSILHPAASH